MYSIKFYGTDNISFISDSDSLVTKTDITAASDLVSYTAYCYSIYTPDLLEQDVYTGVGGLKYNTGSIRKKYNIQLKEFNFDDDGYSNSQLLTTVMNRRKLYFETIEYPITLHDENKLISVVKIGYEFEDTPGRVPISIELEKERNNG